MLGQAHVINVRSYGAMGNGATDDTGAIKRAIEAGSEGYTIYFPSGVYVVKAGINLQAGLSYMGDGPGSVIQQGEGTYTEGLFNLYSTKKPQKIYMSGLRLQGLSAAKSHGLYWLDICYSELKDVWITGFGRTGIYWDVTSGLSCDTNWIRECRVVGNDGNGLYLGGFTDVHLYGCDIGLNAYDNIVLNAYSSSIRYSTVFASSTGHGIVVNADSIQIYGNQIEGNARCGILIQGSYVHVNGNKIYDNANTPKTLGVYDGISVSGNPIQALQGIVITGNFIYSGLYAETGKHRHQIYLNTYHENAYITGNALRYNDNGSCNKTRILVKGLNKTDLCDCQ